MVAGSTNCVHTKQEATFLLAITHKVNAIDTLVNGAVCSGHEEVQCGV